MGKNQYIKLIDVFLCLEYNTSKAVGQDFNKMGVKIKIEKKDKF